MVKKLGTKELINSTLQPNSADYNRDTSAQQAAYNVQRAMEQSGGYVDHNTDVKQTGVQNMKKQPAVSVASVKGARPGRKGK